jgi:hypothetical protein
MIDTTAIQQGGTGSAAAAVFIMAKVVFLESPAGGPTPTQIPESEHGAGHGAGPSRMGNVG